MFRFIALIALLLSGKLNKFKLIISQWILIFHLLVSAFAPMRSLSSKSTTLRMAFETAEGAQKPLGFFDPLGNHWSWNEIIRIFYKVNLLFK